MSFCCPTYPRSDLTLRFLNLRKLSARSSHIPLAVRSDSAGARFPRQYRSRRLCPWVCAYVGRLVLLLRLRCREGAGNQHHPWPSKSIPHSGARFLRRCRSRRLCPWVCAYVGRLVLLLKIAMLGGGGESSYHHPWPSKSIPHSGPISLRQLLVAIVKMA